MQRQLEPELMEDDEQVVAYGQADFEIPHNQFIQRLKKFINQDDFSGTALDLGCGTGDISRRFAQAFPLSAVHAIDGSKAMINYAALTLAEKLNKQIYFIHGRLPDALLPKTDYDIIFSNSLLHHLADPQVLWQTIKRYSRPGTRIVIMDLLRPACIESARTMVKTYAENEPDILQRDFYLSLLAAFSMAEIRQQLAQAELDFNLEQISDRHIFITGVAP